MSKKKLVTAYNDLNMALEVFKEAVAVAEVAGLDVSCDSYQVQDLEDMLAQAAEFAEIEDLIDA